MNLVFAGVMGQAYGDPIAVSGQVLEVDGGVLVLDEGIRSQDDVVGRFYTPSIERRCRRFSEHGEDAEVVGSADSEGQAGLAQAGDSNLGVAGKDLVDVHWVVWEGTDFDAIHGAQCYSWCSVAVKVTVQQYNSPTSAMRKKWARSATNSP